MPRGECFKAMLALERRRLENRSREEGPGTRGMGQPAGLKRLALILRAEERLVKRYYRACASSMIQAG